MNQKIVILIFGILSKLNQVATANDAELLASSEDTLQELYGNIIYTALIFRHGKRTPTKILSNDPNANYKWDEGLGQLTNKGKEGEFMLGKYFKPRYTSLTTEKYDRAKVVMDSSDEDRCLMSAELFLAGYFPPIGSQSWHETLQWQPIPVHTTPQKCDNVISFRQACPKRDLLTEKFFKTSPSIQNICEEYYDVISNIITQSDELWDFQSCNNKTIFRRLVDIQDVLSIEADNNLPLPSWAMNNYPEPLNALRGIIMAIEIEDPMIARLTAGPLLCVIISDMLNIAGIQNTLPKYLFTSDANDTRDLHLFSGHDTTLVALMRALHIYQNENPPYGAALGFELRSKDDAYYVTVIYEKSIEESPQVLEIPGCDDCTLENFQILVTSLIPDDWYKECEEVDTFTDSEKE